MSCFAFCNFCDDIRFELGNKSSLIGLYSTDLLIEAMPSVINKLCVAAFVRIDAKSKISSLMGRLYLGETLLSETSVPEDELNMLIETVKLNDMLGEEVQAITLGFNQILLNLNIEMPSVLKVVMIVDGEEYLAGKLRIKLLPKE